METLLQNILESEKLQDKQALIMHILEIVVTKSKIEKVQEDLFGDLKMIFQNLYIKKIVIEKRLVVPILMEIVKHGIL